MTMTILVSGGKGGCTKTTTALNLGAAFNYFGKDVTVVDTNFTTPNLGLFLGVPMVPVTLNHVLQGKKSITEAMYEHHSGTKIIPSSISVHELKKTDPDKLKKVLKDLKGKTEIILLDGAAGLGRETICAMEAAEEVLIVTNPELPAITDALKTIKIAEELGKRIIGVVVTRKKENSEVSIKNIEAILEYPVLSVVPEDEKVQEAQAMKDILIHTHPRSHAAVAYKRLAAEMLGIDYREKPIANEKGLSKFLRFLGLR